jgi:hypothetical protein
VFHRELTASDLNDAVLLDLLRLEDPLGILSVLTHLEPRAGGIAWLLRW